MTSLMLQPNWCLISLSMNMFHPLCSRAPSVYCCCCLANVSLPGIGVSVPELRPFFYINVADITALETEMSYVACEWSATSCKCL